MRRTPEQVEALDYEALSNLRLFALLFRCGRVPAVEAPDDAGVTRRLLIWCANVNSEDSPRVLMFIIAVIISLPMLILFDILRYLPDLIGWPEWSRYILTIAILVGFVVLGYVSEVAAFKVGKAKLVVEGYKRRVAEKASRRATERRKHYRPISARELDV